MSRRPYDSARFQLLDRITRRLVGCRTADPTTRSAVAVLTASASPARADRLAPGPGEPSALVERLAAWALHRADDAAVARARAVLDEQLDELRSPTVGGTARS